jgi:hypothetical protein
MDGAAQSNVRAKSKAAIQTLASMRKVTTVRLSGTGPCGEGGFAREAGFCRLGRWRGSVSVFFTIARYR